MTVHRQAEIAVQQFGGHNVANSLVFYFHGLVPGPSIPGQPGTQALATDQKRHLLLRLNWRVSHQVHTAGVGPRAQGHAARVDDRHEYQPDRLQLLMQRAVPLESHNQTVQMSQHDFCTNALETMNATKVPHGRYIACRIAQGNHMHRVRAASGHGHFGNDACFKPAGSQFNDALQRNQFG